MARMRRRSLDFAKAHDWDVIVDRLESVYREVLQVLTSFIMMFL